MDSNLSKPSNMDERIQRSQQVYDSLGEEFIKKNNGKYIAVETDTGKHFIGDTREEAVKKANQEYPNSVVFVRRIGSIEKVAGYSPLSFNDPYYARIL